MLRNISITLAGVVAVVLIIGIAFANTTTHTAKRGTAQFEGQSVPQPKKADVIPLNPLGK